MTMSAARVGDARRAREWIEQLLADNHDPDWRVAVTKILAAVDDLDTARDLLALTVPAWVQRHVSLARVRPDDSRRSTPVLATPAKPRRANPPRIDAAAKVYRRILAMQEIANEAGARKFLADMTAAECRYAAAQRDKFAAANAAAAKRYARLADELDRAKAATVRDLDGDVLVEVMTR